MTLMALISASGCKEDIDVMSIAFVSEPSFGEKGKMITVRTTVYSDGKVVEEKITDENVLVSTKQKFIDTADFQKIVREFNKNNFYDFPESFESDILDGSYIGFELQKIDKLYKSGGYIALESNADFKKCYDVFFNTINEE